MIDVFICTVPGTRVEMLHQALDRWLRVKCADELRFHVLRPPPLIEARNFQSYRRVQADVDAQSPVYVVADDDCIVPESGFVDECIRVLERHRDFGILSLWPENATIHPWTPEVYEPFADIDVMEHVSVGNVRFCRKGLLAGKWPDQPGPGYDKEQCAKLRELGYRAGYFRNHKMFHLGEGKTTVWNQEGGMVTV